MSDSSSDKNQRARVAIRRVVDVARRGQARLNAYRQETAALGTWLRSHLFRQGSRKGQQTKTGHSLRSALAARRLRERHRVYCNGGGERSSAAAQALQRAAEAVRQRNG